MARSLLAGVVLASAVLVGGLEEPPCASGSCSAGSAPSLLQKGSAFSMRADEFEEDAAAQQSEARPPLSMRADDFEEGAGRDGAAADGQGLEDGDGGGESAPYVPDCLEELDARKFFDRDVSGHLDANSGTQMIRHVFHDSLDFRNIVERSSGSMDAGTEGGIDACLMGSVSGDKYQHLDVGHNDGLKIAVLVLNQAHHNANLRKFSRADLSVLGATVAIEQNTQGPHLPMKWGRPVLAPSRCRTMAGLGPMTNCVSPPGCPTNSATHGVKTAPPGNSFKFSQVFGAFRGLNYTKREMVSLLGAHTVGMISSCASAHRFPQQGQSCGVGRATSIGFGGANPQGTETKVYDIGGVWDQTPDCFDGRYFASFSKAKYESSSQCCGTLCRLEPHYWGPTCDEQPISDKPLGAGSQQCKIELRWCRRDQHSTLMRNTQDYAFTSTKLQSPMGPGSNLHPSSEAAWGPKKVPLVRTAAEWSFLADIEARGIMEEFGASERSFFDAFQAAWGKMTTRTAGRLQACRPVACSYDEAAARFLCGGRAFPAGSLECAAPPPNASCSLAGNVGTRAVISCGSQERLCCEDVGSAEEACKGSLRAWRHRRGGDVGTCPKAPIVGDTALESNLLLANVSIKEMVRTQWCPWQGGREKCGGFKTEAACLPSSCEWVGGRCRDQVAADPFEDLGPGCCADWHGYIHNAQIGARFRSEDSLEACKTKCLSWSPAGSKGCGYIMHGWSDYGGTWCVILPPESTCGGIVPPGPHACWSHLGNAKVRTYKFLGSIWTDKEPEPAGYKEPAGFECADTSDGLMDNSSFSCSPRGGPQSQFECARSGKRWCSGRPECFGVMTHPTWTVRSAHVKWCTSPRLRPTTGWSAYMKTSGALAPAPAPAPAPEPEDPRWKLAGEGAPAAGRELFDGQEATLDGCKQRCWTTQECESFSWGGACERLTSSGWTRGHYLQSSHVRSYSWIVCAGRCARNSKCEFWTFAPNGKCHLMSEPKGYARSHGHVQGYRQPGCGQCRGFDPTGGSSGSGPPAGTRVYQLREPKPQLWSDQGAGCCSKHSPGDVLFSNSVGTLQQCREKCLTYSDCGFVDYGWSGSQWCHILRKGASCLPLNSGPSDCGSAGNNGVHNYKFTPDPKAVPEPEPQPEPETAPEPEPQPEPQPRSSWSDQGAGCCGSKHSPGDVLFSNWLGTLQQCKEKCLLYSDCGFVDYGWSGSQWCQILRKGASCLPLNSGPSDCGSAGNNGVHNYKFTPDPKAVPEPEPQPEPETAPEPEPQPEPQPRSSWSDQGAGCCSKHSPGDVIFSHWLGTLEQCKEKCLLYSDCGFVDYGWSGSTWCQILRKGASCLPLNSGPSDCGSSGNNGVHNYKYAA